MHNGGMATLEQVVDFYNRGGNFQNDELDPDIRSLDLGSEEKSDLVNFLKNALTDPRVENESEPFDHPQLFIPNGHPGNESFVADGNGDGIANARFVEIPAVGRDGRSEEGLAPLQEFLNVDFENTSPPIDVCEFGDPARVVFVYTGGDCSNMTNDQGGKATCEGDLNEAQPVEIVITKDSDEIVAFPSGEVVEIGDLVMIENVEDGGGEPLKSETRLEIRQGGQTLQELEIHTSCSEPLFTNHQFGGLRLFRYRPVAND